MRRPPIALFVTPLALACLVGFALADHGRPGRHTHTVSRTTADLSEEASTTPGHRLEIDLDTGGEVIIEGWREDRVTLSSEGNGEGCPDADVHVNTRDWGVEVTSKFKPGTGDVHQCSMTLTLRVPTRYDVRVHSSGGGVHVTNLQGTITGRTGGGDLELDHVRGRAELSTGGGDVHVSDCALEGSVRTGGGHVQFDRVSGGIGGSSGSEGMVRRGARRESD